MNLILIVLGALPYVLGWLQNGWMYHGLSSVMPYSLISALFLLIWGGIAFLFRGKVQCTKKVIVFLNLIAAFDLVLLGIQELILHAYWMNTIGAWSQFFYLPILSLGFSLTRWAHIVFPGYAASFVLMIAVSFVGCKLRDRLKK